MCDHRVIDSVKRRMLSRRDLLRAAPAAAIAAAAGSAAPPALAAGASKVHDLTHELDESFPHFFGVQGVAFREVKSFDKDGFLTLELTLNEHSGTHIDAPLHVSADGASVAEIPVESLVAPLAVVDIRAKADESDDAELTPDDLKAWTAANGPFPERCCVAMFSGWESRLGTGKFRNVDGEGIQHYPGFHLEAAQMLMEETSAIGIAVDTLSLDYGKSPDFATHFAWLPTGRWGLENVANLGRLPATGATLIAGAPKWRGGSGGPTRVMALL
ncbi:MAG TPA: cyclase family protein [Thermohalobaculum sp.]|nr:cyclase family protein [Thermohalobaculum sp.]